jgi:hypothetical protein
MEQLLCRRGSSLARVPLLIDFRNHDLVDRMSFGRLLTVFQVRRSPFSASQA